MEKKRFSIKELAKNKSTNTIIPENYVEVKNHIIIHETELANNVQFTLNGNTSTRWFPKSRSMNANGKFYVENWLVKDL